VIAPARIAARLAPGGVVFRLYLGGELAIETVAADPDAAEAAAGAHVARVLEDVGEPLVAVYDGDSGELLAALGAQL